MFKAIRDWWRGLGDPTPQAGHDRENADRKFARAFALCDADLKFAAYARCPCGAGLAYAPRLTNGYGKHAYWDCADIWTGRAIASGEVGAVQHTDRLPFTFWEIKSETQPSAAGATTREPIGAARDLRDSRR